MIDNTSIRVGKGRRTLYWNDDWLGDGSVKELFPDFYSIATLPEANLETVKGVQRWNITFKRLLHDLVLERVVELFKILNSFHGLKDSDDT